MLGALVIYSLYTLLMREMLNRLMFKVSQLLREFVDVTWVGLKQMEFPKLILLGMGLYA